MPGHSWCCCWYEAGPMVIGWNDRLPAVLLPSCRVPLVVVKERSGRALMWTSTSCMHTLEESLQQGSLTQRYRAMYCNVYPRSQEACMQLCKCAGASVSSPSRPPSPGIDREGIPHCHPNAVHVDLSRRRPPFSPCYLFRLSPSPTPSHPAP